MVRSKTTHFKEVFLFFSRDVWLKGKTNICTFYWTILLTNSTDIPSYDNILVETKGEGGCVGLIQLNRPKSLNALCDALMTDLNDALERFNADSSVGCIVLTGSAKAFAGKYQLYNLMIASV